MGAPLELSSRLTSNHPAGCTDFRVLIFKLFRAELWTDADIPPGDRFALSLVYHRDFGREALTAKSISEMARISGRPEESFRETGAALERIMRDVAQGDRFTAWRGEPDRLEFFHNGEEVGALTHDANLFLDIWLGPNSRDSNRRDRLLAGDCRG